MVFVHDRLQALSVDVDSAEAAFERAMELKHANGAAFGHAKVETTRKHARL